LDQTHLALPFAAVVARVRYVSPGMLREFQAAVETVDNSVVIKSVEFADTIVADALHVQTTTLYITGVLASLGFALSMIGVSAVVAYSIASRQHEIGIRLALGATAWPIVTTVLRGSLIPDAAGIMAGLLLANWSSRQLSAVIYGIGPFDGMIYAGVGGVLAFSVACTVFVQLRKLVAQRILVLLRAH
jgi:ABC-type antimicrobial peptide transport system permease subunit